jgi:hypothetical protein
LVHGCSDVSVENGLSAEAAPARNGDLLSRLSLCQFSLWIVSVKPKKEIKEIKEKE